MENVKLGTGIQLSTQFSKQLDYILGVTAALNLPYNFSDWKFLSCFERTRWT